MKYYIHMFQKYFKNTLNTYSSMHPCTQLAVQEVSMVRLLGTYTYTDTVNVKCSNWC